MSPFYSDSQAVLAGVHDALDGPQGRDRARVARSCKDQSGTPLVDSMARRTAPKAEAKARNGGASAKLPVKFNEQKTTFIKHTLENGLMSPEVLAGMFKCDVADIKAVLG